MASLIETCAVSEGSVVNTGIENNCALDLAAGIIIVPGNAKWSASDMADPVAWLTAKFHAAPADRFLPVFKGMFDFGYARESAVTEANPIKGTTRTIRLGGFTFTYTWEGGLCLAGRLMGLQGRNYRYIPFDKDSQFMVQKNADGTYSGLESTDVTSDFLPKTPTTSAKNVLVLNTPYDKYVKAEMFKSDTDLTDMNGLIDVDVIAVAGTTTKLTINVATHCAHKDLIAEYGADLSDLTNFIVRNKATGAVVTPTSIAIVSGRIEITGTFVSGQTYTVELAAASVLQGNDIEGYDGLTKPSHTI